VDRKQQGQVSRDLRKIGFSLERYGTFEARTEAWILPREKCACLFDIEVDPQSLSCSRQCVDRPDVCRSKWDQPIDESEGRCLKDMEKALDQLRARNGAWSPVSSESSVRG
jgi:hypothetical protein